MCPEIGLWGVVFEIDGVEGEVEVGGHDGFGIDRGEMMEEDRCSAYELQTFAVHYVRRRCSFICSC